MNQETKPTTVPTITGHMTTLGPGHWMALYKRNHESYVAEFRDDAGTFEHASLWFRLHAGVLRYANGHAVLQSSMPLTSDILEKIERLHAESEARQERMRAVARNVIATVMRGLRRFRSWVHGAASRTSATTH